MTAEEIRELELWISEAMGWKYERTSDITGYWHPPQCGPDYNAKTPNSKCQFAEHTKHSPAWTTDESASAMLLDMLPTPTLWHDANRRWYVTSTKYEAVNSDRKLAIALAFKAWKQLEEKEQR